MDVNEIAKFSQMKGLNLVGTGDSSHPQWIEELRKDLKMDLETQLFKSNNFSRIFFMITGEVSTVFMFRGAMKKIHHLILTPNFETATQINDRLEKYGDLSIDGRPTLQMTAPHLVEEVMALSPDNEVVPAHVWTPWFSLFGAFSGFDKIEDCYQDMTKHIHALETGLSSDPPMNWRLSALDKFTLISNSDSHSCWPWRIGREANVFDVEKPSYKEILEAIRTKDSHRFKFTIETNPAYGKYHWTGHRTCKVSMSPRDAMRFNNHCPVCRRKLTKGVEQRVEELADRPTGFKPENAGNYLHLLPLSDIITTAIGASSPIVQGVWSIYDNLIAKFGNEYAVLIDAPEKELEKTADSKISEAIVRVRKKKIQVIPGYDGVYGQLVLFEDRKRENIDAAKISQRNLKEWCNYS